MNSHEHNSTDLPTEDKNMAMESALLIAFRQGEAFGRRAAIESTIKVLQNLLAEEDSRMSGPVENLELTVRTTNLLKNNDIRTVGDFVNLTDSRLSEIRNLGEKGRREVYRKLEELNVSRPMINLPSPIQ